MTRPLTLKLKISKKSLIMQLIVQLMPKISEGEKGDVQIFLSKLGGGQQCFTYFFGVDNIVTCTKY